MGMKFSKNDRQEISQMSIEELVNYTREIGITAVGVNYRNLLSEFALRLNIATDGVSVIVSRRVSKRDPSQGFDVWQWGIYSEDRLTAFRAMPGRKWNSSPKCNSFVAMTEDDPLVFNPLKVLYKKLIVISENGFRIDEGEAAPEWNNSLLYQLSETPLQVYLDEVLKGFYALRPNDHPSALALHGEYDDRFRTLFDESISANFSVIEDLGFKTQHSLLLFRVPQTDGKPRYLVYSVENRQGVDVVFAESKELKQCLAQFKETQQRLAIPLVESLFRELPTTPPTSRNKPPSRRRSPR